MSRRNQEHTCRGKQLPLYHDEVACHAQGEKRNEILRLLNCWIDTIEGPGEPPERPCEGSVLCYPEFSCTKGTPVKKPRCIGSGPLPDPEPPTPCLPTFSLPKPPPPIWERPRVKSSQLIGSEFKKVKECFRANGLNDTEWCPRDENCQVMCSLEQMIEEDRRIHGERVMQPDCCCRPGDAPSRMPQFHCITCEPPTKHGYLSERSTCPAERGHHTTHQAGCTGEEQQIHPGGGGGHWLECTNNNHHSL